MARQQKRKVMRSVRKSNSPRYAVSDPERIKRTLAHPVHHSKIAEAIRGNEAIKGVSDSSLYSTRVRNKNGAPASSARGNMQVTDQTYKRLKKSYPEVAKLHKQDPGKARVLAGKLLVQKLASKYPTPALVAAGYFRGEGYVDAQFKSLGIKSSTRDPVQISKVTAAINADPSTKGGDRASNYMARVEEKTFSSASASVATVSENVTVPRLLQRPVGQPDSGWPFRTVRAKPKRTVDRVVTEQPVRSDISSKEGQIAVTGRTIAPRSIQTPKPAEFPKLERQVVPATNVTQSEVAESKANQPLIINDLPVNTAVKEKGNLERHNAMRTNSAQLQPTQQSNSMVVPEESFVPVNKTEDAMQNVRVATKRGLDYAVDTVEDVVSIFASKNVEPSWFDSSEILGAKDYLRDKYNINVPDDLAILTFINERVPSIVSEPYCKFDAAYDGKRRFGFSGLRASELPTIHKPEFPDAKSLVNTLEGQVLVTIITMGA